MKKLLPLLLLVFGFNAQAATPNFGFLCGQLLQENPWIDSYSSHFTENFRTKVPLDYLKSIFSDLYAETGKCLSYKTVETSEGVFQLTTIGEKNIELNFILTFDAKQKLFDGLRLEGLNNPAIQIQKWEDLVQVLKSLDPHGTLSATLVTPDHSVELTHNGAEVFAIGSTFKLYVLGALQTAISAGLHQWNEILPIKEEWKSFPSGTMHNLPAGQEVALSEYAEKMISISDNTATDHLLYFLGRENVEQMLEPMGNSHEAAYLPFLSTSEMFKLKWAIKPSEAQDYILQNKTERLATLTKIQQVPREQVGTNGVSSDKPVLINQLEWYATTPENCKAMFWLASQNSPQIRSILAKSAPFVKAGTESSHWAYAGFKGGSEPGVLSMTFLLESKKGQRACFAISWNNPTENVSEYRLGDIIKKTLSFAETQIP